MSAEPPAPIQSQPQWNNDFMFPKPTAVVPPGLECLVEVEEVILKKEVFRTKDGQELFTVRQESECCGPSLNLFLRNTYKRDVLNLLLESDGFCCKGETDLKISTDHCIGIVNISSSAGYLNVSIQRENREPLFRARVLRYVDPNAIINMEILCVNGSQPVAHIIQKREGYYARVIFRFPPNLEAALKAIILGAFLYMRLHMRLMLPSHSSRDANDTAVGVLSSESYHHHHDNDPGHNHDGSGGQDGDCGGGGWADEGGCCSGGDDCVGGGDDCVGGGGDFGSGFDI